MYHIQNEGIKEIASYYELQLKKMKGYYEFEIDELKGEISRQYHVISLMKKEVEDLMVLVNFQQNSTYGSQNQSQ